MKREILYIKHNNEWTKETEDKPILTNVIKKVANENIKQMMDLKIKFHPQNDLEKASNIAAFMFNHFITNQE